MLAYGAVCLLALALYTWTAKTSADLAPSGKQTDPFNLLATSFLHGHTYLPLHSDPRLPDLDHGWDPRVRQFVTPDTLDLSYFDKRFYVYWGPAPVVLFFVPWRVLPLGDLPVALVVLGLAFAVLLLEIAILEGLARRFLPGTPTWMRALGALGLAFGNAAPYLLRRPAVYEVTHLSGVAFALGGLILLWTAVERGPPRWGRAALAVLLFGLAILSRLPAFGVLVAIPIALWWLRSRGELPGRDRWWRAPVALGAPLAACLAVYAAYNAIRFNSPFEFGERFQVNSLDPTNTASLSFLPGGLWYYLICPPRLVAEFPFLWLNAIPNTPFSMPARYQGLEPTAGILAVVPLTWLFVAGRAALAARPAALKVAVATLVAYAAVVLLFVSVYIAGATERYEADFVPPLLIAATLVWFALADRLRERRPLAVAVRAFGVAAVAWACLTGVAFSFVGLRFLLRVRHPDTYESLRRDTEPIATLMAKLAGHPILSAVDELPTVGPNRYDRLGVEGVDLVLRGISTPLQVVAPHDGAATLEARLAGAGSRVAVDSSAGSHTTARVRGAVARFPVRLKTGLNVLTVRVAGGRGLVHFDDVRLRDER